MPETFGGCHGVQTTAVPALDGTTSPVPLPLSLSHSLCLCPSLSLSFSLSSIHSCQLQSTPSPFIPAMWVQGAAAHRQARDRAKVCWSSFCETLAAYFGPTSYPKLHTCFTGACVVTHTRWTGLVQCAPDPNPPSLPTRGPTLFQRVGLLSQGWEESWLISPRDRNFSWLSLTLFESFGESVRLPLPTHFFFKGLNIPEPNTDFASTVLHRDTGDHSDYWVFVSAQSQYERTSVRLSRNVRAHGIGLPSEKAMLGSRYLHNGMRHV